MESAGLSPPDPPDPPDPPPLASPPPWLDSPLPDLSPAPPQPYLPSSSPPQLSLALRSTMETTAPSPPEPPDPPDPPPFASPPLCLESPPSALSPAPPQPHMPSSPPPQLPLTHLLPDLFPPVELLHPPLSLSVQLPSSPCFPILPPSLTPPPPPLPSMLVLRESASPPPMLSSHLVWCLILVPDSTIDFSAHDLPASPILSVFWQVSNHLLRWISSPNSIILSFVLFFLDCLISEGCSSSLLLVGIIVFLVTDFGAPLVPVFGIARMRSLTADAAWLPHSVSGGGWLYRTTTEPFLGSLWLDFSATKSFVPSALAAEAWAVLHFLQHAFSSDVWYLQIRSVSQTLIRILNTSEQNNDLHGLLEDIRSIILQCISVIFWFIPSSFKTIQTLSPVIFEV